MKRSIVSVFVPFLILHVCIARVFDEKSEAIKEIEKKFNEALVSGNATLMSAEKEKTQVNDQGEKALKTYLLGKIGEAKSEFENDASAVIRTAIVTNKPISVIYCIRNVVYASSKSFADATNENEIKVLQVRTKKLEKIDFDVYAIKAITTGLKELVEQAKKQINEGSGGIQAVKKEALKRCESAILLLGEIEVCLHEPVLAREYIKMRQEIDKSLREVKSKLSNDLNTCLNQKLS